MTVASARPRPGRPSAAGAPGGVDQCGDEPAFGLVPRSGVLQVGPDHRRAGGHGLHRLGRVEHLKRPERRIGGIALASGLAAMIGNVALAGTSPAVISTVTALAAGAILAMLVDTMIPEATEKTHEFSGLIAVTGFLLAFILSKSGGG